ncbi:MAG TPA: GNA1162 family protein [Planctomycetota bacterium]|nr:GNA1162 family protein [Planctomycetota bacterium]
MKRLALAALALVTVSGCGSSRVYLNRDVTTVAVLIPFNETSASNHAALKMWTFVEQEVASRGYRLVAHAKVGAFYDAKKYTDPAQIQEWSTEELAKEFQADAIVRSHLVAWDANTIGIYSKVEVALTAEMRAADGTKDGALAWSGEGKDGYSQTAAGKGILRSVGQTMMADPGKYAPGAASVCFQSLPWAGWDPETPRPPAK